TPPVVAPAELEVDVAYALDPFRTRLGDQFSLTKTAAGILEVKGVVESDETRKEILGALSRFIGHPALRVQLSTVAEVLARQQQQPARLTVREFAGSDQSIPLYA